MAFRTHPFGPPMEATLSQDGGDLLLTWTAAEDDWVIIGELSGAFASREQDESGEDALASSPEVHEFLAAHLVVSQDGQECAREWLPTQDLLGEGVRASFTCADPEAPVSVYIDVLTDENEAYRTLLQTEGGHQVLFTDAEPQHEFAAAQLDVDGSAGGDQLLLLLVLGLLVLLGAVGLGVGLSRAGRSKPPSPSTPSSPSTPTAVRS